MDVFSNVPGIVTGTTSAPASCSSGPVITAAGNGYGVPNATGGWASATAGLGSPGYGSMKLATTGRAQQMLISFNDWTAATMMWASGTARVPGYNHD